MRKIIVFTWLIVLIFISCNQRSKEYEIAYSSETSGNPEIFLTNINGSSRMRLTTYSERDGYPSWAPDGKKIAFYAYHGKETWSIYTMKSDGSGRKRLTYADNVWDNSPVWSPDGNRIAFAREYRDTMEIWLMNADGSNQTRINTISGGGPCFTRDGRILFHTPYGDSEICIADINGNNIIQLTDNNAEDWHPEISPDNNRILFMSDRDGNYEIYCTDIDGKNETRLTNNESGDWEPCWSPDGRKVLFTSDRDGDFDIYIMNIDGSDVKNLTNNDVQDLQASWKHIQQ
jgi:TolB protein